MATSLHQISPTKAKEGLLRQYMYLPFAFPLLLLPASCILSRASVRGHLMHASGCADGSGIAARTAPPRAHESSRVSASTRLYHTANTPPDYPFPRTHRLGGPYSMQRTPLSVHAVGHQYPPRTRVRHPEVRNPMHSVHGEIQSHQDDRLYSTHGEDTDFLFSPLEPIACGCLTNGFSPIDFLR